MFITDENAFIEKLVRNFPRSSRQINSLQESDAELIHLNGDLILALTTDSICEEIERGIYEDPYLIGWMTVTANASDIAAVGASPLGILLSQTFTREASSDFVDELQRGIQDACKEYKLPLLGGDTNFSNVMQMGGTALGLIDGGTVLQRKGCAPNELLYCSASLGSGNAYAFCKLAGIPFDGSFKPYARIAEGNLLRHYATSCMDTSDGFLATIDQLKRINNLGFRITSKIEDYVSTDAKMLCKTHSIPLWFMLAGLHGEFELVFTIPSCLEKRFLIDAGKIGWKPMKLGVVAETPAIELLIHDQYKIMDTSCIKSIFGNSNHDLSYYINELMKIANNFERREQ